jgi:hypothetical protein
MATKEQKEQLLEVLKFTPRTYNIYIGGYGGESYAGKVDRATYEYFKEKKIDIEQYASDWDNLFDDVPNELQPFNPGSPYECDNLFHASGAELSSSNEIVVNDELGNQHWACNAGLDSLEDDGVTVNDTGGCNLDDLPEDTIVLWGGQGEKGTFFDGEFELRAPFDPKLLTVNYENCDGWCIINGVEYDGEEIDGTGAYSTTGKWAEHKWILCNGEEVYDSEERAEDSDNKDSEEVEWPEPTCNDETDDNVLEVAKTDWYPLDIKPVYKGTYECEFESATWPFPIERMCEWTGRSWKENGGKVLGIKRWRGLVSESYNNE